MFYSLFLFNVFIRYFYSLFLLNVFYWMILWFVFVKCFLLGALYYDFYCVFFIIPYMADEVGYVVVI